MNKGLRQGKKTMLMDLYGCYYKTEPYTAWTGRQFNLINSSEVSYLHRHN